MCMQESKAMSTTTISALNSNNNNNNQQQKYQQQKYHQQQQQQSTTINNNNINSNNINNVRTCSLSPAKKLRYYRLPLYMHPDKRKYFEISESQIAQDSVRQFF